MDQCTNCTIIIGPCESSVFIRNIENSKIYAICQQFRTRDCKNLDIFLFCRTEPIIETSTQMKFNCFFLSWLDLGVQFKNSKLSVWDNKWWQVRLFIDCHNFDIS